MGNLCRDGGVNFAFYSRNAWAVELLLYEGPGDREPAYDLILEPPLHRTGDVWHIFAEGIGAGWFYNLRISGPWKPSKGLRFNINRVLVDPWARAFSGVSSWDVELSSDRLIRPDNKRKSIIKQDNAFTAAKAIVTDGPTETVYRRPEWRRPINESIIYETHVKGFTADPSSGVKHPGTYAGLVEKIPYLKKLGITAIELLPVHEFNENEVLKTSPLTGKRLTNYWGYSTMGFFAPKEGYAASKKVCGQVKEFREMVDMLHENGIELILDVVFNHTGEGDEKGPTLHMKGMENSVWYMLEDEDKTRYRNFSGCGNTLNCNHPVVASFILECLRYWVLEMGVDGFRFDLASILCRGRDGELIAAPPLIDMITEDPVMQDVKLIAEAWDAGGAWQVGSFPGGKRWSDWNGVYRDDVRRFWRGDPFMTSATASRICGSEDIYGQHNKKPGNSINFITCHDGFTLNDLVSYNHKHNEMNGEHGMDGSDMNFSFNCGAEGPSNDPAVNTLRARQVRNFMTTLFLSRGVPMLSGGDEFLRTQSGNNNAYCQDNSISWYDWSMFNKNRWLYDFIAQLADIRKRHPQLTRNAFYTHDEIRWFNAQGHDIDWNSPDNLFGAMIFDEKGSPALCILANALDREVSFSIPDSFNSTGISRLRIIVDTAVPLERGNVLRSDNEILPENGIFTYPLISKSMVIMEAT